jgi:AmiR/NasT family two-component response regulator
MVSENPIPENTVAPLRVLIANERRLRLELLGHVISGLGHEVVAVEVDVRDVGAATAREHPDVALVGLGESSQHALDLIEQIVRESTCPVIALLGAEDPEFIRDAANRGVFAYVVDTVPGELQSAIDITLRRFAEYHDLQGAFKRRAVIEQAKGILMARHSIDADQAFGMMRDHSQRSGEKLTDVAASIVNSHLLLRPPAA